MRIVNPIVESGSGDVIVAIWAGQPRALIADETPEFGFIDDLRTVQSLLRRASRHDACRAMGRLACLEGRRQGVRDRWLAGKIAEFHLQGKSSRLRDAQGDAGTAARTLSRVARHDLDSAPRKARAQQRR